MYLKTPRDQVTLSGPALSALVGGASKTFKTCFINVNMFNLQNISDLRTETPQKRTRETTKGSNHKLPDEV